MSIIAWAAGYAVNKIRDVAVSKLTQVSLEDKLQKKVDKWLVRYSYAGSVSEALFNAGPKGADGFRPSRELLAEQMLASKVPPAELWFQALKEQFEAIQRSIPDEANRQLLFQKDFTEVEKEFRELASELHEVCIQDTGFFQSTIFEMLAKLVAAIKKERPVTELLEGLADFLDNKRVLYQPFIREARNPLLPVILAAEQVRLELSNHILPGLAAANEAREEVRRMLQTCRSFLDRLAELPSAVRQDKITPIKNLKREQIDLIEDALFYFRSEFTAPLFGLLTRHGVAIPVNILYHTNLGNLNVPDRIFFDGLPLVTGKSLCFAGESDGNVFLRIATLAEKLILGGIEWPAGTELTFYDPLPTGAQNRVLSAQSAQDFLLGDELCPAGGKIYFDLNGDRIREFPEGENPYTYLDRLNEAKKRR